MQGTVVASLLQVGQEFGRDRRSRYRPAVGPGPEDFVGDDGGTVGGDDVADGTDEAAVLCLGDLHHEVDGGGGEEVRRFERKAFWRLDGVEGEFVEDRGRGVGVDGAHGSVVALAQGVEEGHDFGAAHFAEEYPIGIHPQ